MFKVQWEIDGYTSIAKYADLKRELDSKDSIANHDKNGNKPSALKLIIDVLKTQCNTDDHNGDESIDFYVPPNNENQTQLPATTRKCKVFCESKPSNDSPSETAPLKNKTSYYRES